MVSVWESELFVSVSLVPMSVVSVWEFEVDPRLCILGWDWDCEENFVGGLGANDPPMPTTSS